MKVRCVNNNWNNLTKGKVYDVIYIIDSEIQIYNDLGDKQTFYIGNFEVIKEENEMQEKTFREVIADIKEGEVWVNEIAPINFIRLREDGVLDFNKNEGINLNVKYKLQRKGYTFEEAFKAYEKGIKVESEYSGISYKKKNKTQVEVSCDNDTTLESEFNISFSTGEIRGKWYINN